MKNKSAVAGLLLGYARVSTDDQDLTNQRAELHAAGCTKLFSEKITGTRRDRPELARMLDHLRPGDVVTVTRLDRLARSTRDLLDIAERIQEAGAGLRSLAEPWADTTTPAGRMVLTVFAGIAEFERSLIIDRTRSGREAAKARGVKFGPRPTLTPAQIAHARELIDTEGRTVKEAAALLGVHRSTLYRALERSEEVTLAEAKRRGAFREDALTEADAMAAVGDQDERQEEGPIFLDDEGPMEPPTHVSTVRLHDILAGLSDAELAAWPAQLGSPQKTENKAR
ncbi:recombinase family protein [Pseudomonas aeruginosa]|uniref:recombinase family protein n=1 Tax=Pseudomonas aeruginosa TaxID=287 RepID=UPI000AED0385